MQNCVHTTGKSWMGESNVRVAWVLAVNYGRGGCARDTTVVDKNNKVKMGREADRRSPFIPRHDDIMTRRDCIESFYITAYIRIDRTRRSNSPIGRKYRAAGCH